FQLTDTGRTISAWRFNIQSNTASSNPANQTLKAGGQPLNGNGYMVFPDKEFPALSFTAEDNHKPRTLTIPEALTWQTRRSINPVLVLEQLPIIIPADGTLTFTSHLTALPDVFKKSRNMSLQIRSRQFYDQQQQTIMSTMPISETDKAETHSLNFLQAPKKIDLTASLGNIPIAATRTLTCIEPDDSFRGVRPRGSHLYKANNPAMLLLNTSDTTRHKQKRQNNNSQKLESLFIVDEFWSIGKAPDGGQDIREIIAGKSGLSVSHKHIDTVKSASPRELQKFALVDDALNSDADAIVWAVGVTDLRAGIKYSEVINRLRFLTEATLAHGKIPVLVTVPPVAGIPAEQLHRFAVAVKQYGLGIKIPVVDTYSKAAGNLKTFSAFLKTKDPQVNLSYPNVEGRRWFCRLLQNSLKATQNARSD
ncbi:MAG: SGNH/GDSL hydrolase family protein, partial [Lentisphaeria bacterium]